MEGSQGTDGGHGEDDHEGMGSNIPYDLQKYSKSLLEAIHLLAVDHTKLSKVADLVSASLTAYRTNLDPKPTWMDRIPDVIQAAMRAEQVGTCLDALSSKEWTNILSATKEIARQYCLANSEVGGDSTLMKASRRSGKGSRKKQSRVERFWFIQYEGLDEEAAGKDVFSLLAGREQKVGSISVRLLDGQGDQMGKEDIEFDPDYQQ
ncbi:hypothetical protein M231_06861 [Tremella mesenterica]|uniref:Uncharacterized protein n=1 Tax=Tremella mesenterica TaxID=5217 RepID=A0A4Q1BEU2_TREME|nr:hypothetical protein M231_06861 [Tremella mesenterica]